MGIKERILELKQQDLIANEAREAEKVREQEARRIANEAARENHEKSQQNLDTAILQQRVLFNELSEIGLIGMLEEVVGEKVKPLLTREEDEVRMEEFNKNWKENVHANFEKMKLREREQGWEANVQRPEQHEDGTFDSTLNIKLTKSGFDSQVYFDSPHWSEVLISYSEDKTLRIFGRNTEYVGKIDSDLNTERLEKGLAHAIHRPMGESSQSVSSRMSLPRRRPRIGATS